MTSYVRKVDIVKDSANVAGRKKIVYVDASSDTTVPAGSTETITIQPPQGKIWRVLDMVAYILPPANATTGWHRIRVCSAFTYDWFSITLLTDYDKGIHFIHQVTDTATSKNYNSIMNRLRTLKFTSQYPLLVVYRNGTDVEQTNKRIVDFIIEEEDKAL